jgi:hypothetical protein
MTKELQYEAISYAWGSGSSKKIIMLDSKPFQVTENLYSALQNLRYDERHIRLLWIDAICID